jgi:hypothetical protein
LYFSCNEVIAVKNVSLIVRFDDVSVRDSYELRRIEGTLTPESMIRLLDVADLKANPREARDSNVTEAIIESIEKTPELHHFKSKGILMAAGECEPLERKRFRLSFDDEDLEGILDGGHNLLACARYFLQKVVPDEARELRGAKRWDDIVRVWSKYRDDVWTLRDDFDFLVPVEIIYPHDGAKGRDDYENAILEIAQARNNNAQLTAETRAHKAGYYEVLKDALDLELVSQIEWKTNDGGRIKAREVVALAMVPLLALKDRFPRLGDFSPVYLYSNKAHCVKTFNDLMEDDSVSVRDRGDIRRVTDHSVKSALSRMAELPRLFDLVYAEFPDAYNTISPGFGRIRSVRLFEEGRYEKGDKKYLPRPPTTRYYGQPCHYDFPDGFVWPIVYGLGELLELRQDDVVWRIDPEVFVKQHLKNILRVFHGIISIADYDPQRVGKTLASYEMARSQIAALLTRA